MKLTTVQEMSSALAGAFSGLAISTDAIGRVVSVSLSRDSEHAVCLESRMIDLAEREEIGQLSIRTQDSDVSSLRKPPESLQLNSPLSLTQVFRKESDIGSVVVGVQLENRAGVALEVFCSSEIYSLYLRLGSLSCSGEPEFERSMYDSVVVS